ncbi:MAG: TetR/AcrR family transcriptional regulator [Lachnospiraceae bacterium]|nr:TetR/AcrR family transcriptional regulator [Lachnospiraceae bacterium]
MPNFTEKAIKETFLKLLEERPLSQITIKDIVEECGINRNSFYYHFADLPTLIEEIVTEQIDTLIQEYPTIDSMEQCIDAALAFALQHKRACLHIYNSLNREIFERYLMKECEYVVTTYFRTVFPNINIKKEDQEIIIAYHKFICYGAIIDWLNKGMQDDLKAAFLRLSELGRGITAEMVSRSLEG